MKEIKTDSETAFLSGMMELGCGLDVEKKLKKFSRNVEWARGWPEDKKAFWNAEAFMWGYKIEKEKRKLIEKELSFLKKGRNLDLGCGAYSYIPSVGFDFSEKMLDFNDRCSRKIVGDLEKELPFKDHEFDSATAVFVLNYIQNYENLLKEVRRILKEKGNFVIVLYSKSVNDWQRQKEINSFSAEKWTDILKKNGFLVQFYEKEKLWFFKCKKRLI